MERIIEDADGAPLPDELQPGSHLWDAAYFMVFYETGNHELAIERADAAAVAVAPILFPEVGD